MSKFNILLCAILFLILALVSCNKESNTYKLSGKLENVAGGYFYMSHEIGDSIFVDTIPINGKGEFSFRGSIDTLTEASLYFNGNTRTTFILLDKGWNVELKGDVLYSDLIDVKGGTVNDDLTEFKNKNKDLLKSRADILIMAEKSNSNNDSLFVKDYVVELKNINFELSNITTNYIRTYPDKIASVMLINSFFKDETSIPRLDENLSLLKGKAVDFPLTAELKDFRDKVKMSSVNSLAPNFSLKDVNGKTINLIDFRGKYVLLSFVATTCDICNAERADAVVVYNQLKKQKKNIEFITIVKDIEQEPITSNVTDSVKWSILPVNGGWSAKMFDLYYVRAIPYNILISPTGIILERDIHILALPTKFDEWLGEK